MDWAKAKNVLIVVFILLNIFLAANLMLFFRQDSAQGKNTIKAAQILEDRGVVLKCKIPEISGSCRISYENAALDEDAMASVLLNNNQGAAFAFKYGEKVTVGSKSLVFYNNSSFKYTDSSPGDKVDLADTEKTIRYCAKFLENLKLPISSYYADKYIKKSNGAVSIVFKEKVKNYIVFSNNFQVEVTDKGITSLTGSMVKVEGIQGNKDKGLVAAYQILLRHYIGEKAAITEIDIGFDCKYIEEGKSSSTYPIWRVRTEAGSERYFSAIDGSEQEM